jgi:XTP/dITP diphosphohydrolase
VQVEAKNWDALRPTPSSLILVDCSFIFKEMRMKKLVLASSNKNKLSELQALLTDLDVNIIPQSEFNVKDVEETGLSFIENAILKARNAAAQTDMPALADDSGLVVNALHGAPGIYSARYSGKEASDQKNIALLLENLKDIPKEHRQAHFMCVIAYVEHANDPTPIIAQGRLDGIIIDECKGDNGFGYDPIFYIHGINLTAAQLPAQIKNKISHRAKALEQFSHLFHEAKKVYHD